jgi:pyocin large subunit-like protein
MLNGKPEWADNRQHSAQENLSYQFEHWGAALGAKDETDYAKRARSFIDHPPKSAEKVTRPNGDVLVYDKASNTFAIARRDGAPRLFRKPPGGAADWERAKSEAPRGGGASQRRYRAPSAGDYRGAAD